jgi:putative SOS response-associated peptidase YedK
MPKDLTPGMIPRPYRFGQCAISQHHESGRHHSLFRELNRYVGNLAPMPGVFPDYPAPVVRNTGAEGELIMMRWGMPPPPRAGYGTNAHSGDRS